MKRQRLNNWADERRGEKRDVPANFDDADCELVTSVVNNKCPSIACLSVCPWGYVDEELLIISIALSHTPAFLSPHAHGHTHQQVIVKCLSSPSPLINYTVTTHQSITREFTALIRDKNRDIASTTTSTTATATATATFATLQLIRGHSRPLSECVCVACVLRKV